jgi:hypothetical protein
MASVGYATLQIIPSTRGFGSALNSGIGPDIDREGTRAGGRFGGAMGGGLVGGMKGLAAPLLAAVGGAAVIGGLKSIMSAGSDLNETISKSNVIFGSSAKEMLKWADNSVTTLGISKAEALATGSSFGDMFKQIGLGPSTVATLSKSFLGLSADIGSFQNASTGDVSSAFQSALRGEYESIQRFLPAISGARVATEALNLTHKASVKDLTAADKAQALYSLALKDGNSAVGDYGKTHGQVAGQTKEFAGHIANLQAQIGTYLLPVMTTAITSLNAMFGVFATFASSGFVASLGTGFVALGSAISATTGFFADHTTTLQVLSGIITALVLPSIYTMIAGLIATGAAAVASAARQVAAWLTTQVASLATTAILLVNFGLTVAGWVLVGVQATLGALRMAAAWLIALGPVGAVIAAVVGVTVLIVKNWDTIVSATTSAFNAVWGAVQSAFNWIIGKIASFGSAIVGAVRFVVEFQVGLARKFGEVVAYITTLPGEILSALGNLGSLLLSAGSDLIRGFISGIQSMAGAIISAIKSSITDVLPGFVKKALGIHSPSRVFMALGKNVSEGMALGISAGTPKVLAAMEGLTSISSGTVTGSVSVSGGTAPSAHGGLAALAAGNRDVVDAVLSLKDEIAKQTDRGVQMTRKGVYR